MSQSNTVKDVCSEEVFFLDLEGKDFPGGQSIHYSNICHHKSVYHTEEVVIPPMCEGGDYSEGLFIAKANIEFFKQSFEKHPDVFYLYGSHGSVGLGIRATCTDEEIIQAVASLSEYSVLSYDILNEIEEDAKEDAWDSWIHSELERVLREKFDSHNLLCDAEVSSGELYQLFYTLQDRTGEYIRPDGGSMWVNIKKLVAAADAKDFKSLLCMEEE